MCSSWHEFVRQQMIQADRQTAFQHYIYQVDISTKQQIVMGHVNPQIPILIHLLVNQPGIGGFIAIQSHLAS